MFVELFFYAILIRPAVNQQFCTASLMSCSSMSF